MRWKPHVRFGGRVGETHQPQGWQGAPARPDTEHPTAERKVYCCADGWSWPPAAG
jgi:hypothetical protein